MCYKEKMQPKLLLFPVALSLLGCQPRSLLPEGFSSCEAPAPFTLPARPITYFEDIKPIFDARCVECHAQTGIAPFPLDNFVSSNKHAEEILPQVLNRLMPPWPPDDCCADYDDKRSLTEEQIALIAAWVEQKATPGDPALEGPPLEPVTIELPRIDLTLRMPEPFVPEALVGDSDELRCFVLDLPFGEEKFVTGLNVRPANRSIVHHVALMTLNQEDALAAEREDALDDRAGFDCHSFNLELNPTGNLGGWAPGYRSVIYPDGVGLRVPAGSFVLMQVHYDISHSTGEPDQTEVDFMLEDEVELVGRGMAVGDPLWLFDGGMRLPAGEEDVMYNFSYDPTVVITRGEPFRIYGVNLHMHELGTSGSLAILRKDGSTDCLFHTTRWDFDWLGQYELVTPIDFFPGDELYVECHWSTLGLSEDLQWGADEEMCGGLFLITDLP